MQRREFVKLAFSGTLGAFVAPGKSEAHPCLTAIGKPSSPRRLKVENCFAAIIDVQPDFLSQLQEGHRSAILKNLQDFAHLLSFFRIPTVVTLEEPVNENGLLPEEITEKLRFASKVFKKISFDVTMDEAIAKHLKSLGKRQVILAGCETDVCILQSCLGFLGLGYDVFPIENLLFTSSPNVNAALSRMAAEGAVLISYKSMFYELARNVDRSGSFDESPLSLND
jgi:nicotinamidase-related amidase